MWWDQKKLIKTQKIDSIGQFSTNNEINRMKYKHQITCNKENKPMYLILSIVFSNQKRFTKF